MADPDGTPVPNTAEYNTIRENPFKSTASSPLSTFSIDVDTPGYTKLKYDILDGFQIEKDEVKIEELINYFNYDYSGDRVGEEPFTVSTEYTCCPWNPEHRLVRIGIRADDRQEKPATNFVLVTDISGSMMLINKLPLALSAYADMLEGFDEEDTISLMYYASGQGIVLENGVYRAVGCGSNHRAGFCGKIHTVVGSPVPGGWIVAQAVHGIVQNHFTIQGHSGFQGRFCGQCGLAGMDCGGTVLPVVAAGIHHIHRGMGILQGRIRFVCVAVVQIAGDPDGHSTQDQGYVVALADKFAKKVFLIVAHISTSEAQYCQLSGK
jgi:hypothetical protein